MKLRDVDLLSSARRAVAGVTGPSLLIGFGRVVARVTTLASGFVLAVALALILSATLRSLPEGVGRVVPGGSLRVLDRTGVLLAELRGADGKRALPVELDAVSPEVRICLMAAEDARFRRHLGLDPLSIARALLQLVEHGRAVSGASTLTQQYARQLIHRPRTMDEQIGRAHV